MFFMVYKYFDYFFRLKSFFIRIENFKEEVLLKKKIVYMVDVCFFVYFYVKLFVFLFVIVFFIGFGGLVLYAVSDNSFVEVFWFFWIFVADFGNYVDRVGIGSRIVFVFISVGGMLIFVMMLGFVFDVILEKVDLLRKGKSEVIESNYVLIFGWSDKLVSLCLLFLNFL